MRKILGVDEGPSDELEVRVVYFSEKFRCNGEKKNDQLNKTYRLLMVQAGFMLLSKTT